MASFFGIQDWFHRKVDELSGGQKAKVLLLKMSLSGADVLILDEILGIVDQGIISKEEFQSFLEARDEETELVMTGRVCPEGIEEYVTDISRMENIDVDNHQE